MKHGRWTALLAAAMVFITGVIADAADTVLDDVSEEMLIRGVNYKHITRLTTNGWQDIHIVEADLNEPHLKFSVLTDPQGVSHMTNVLNLAKEHDAIAAINADFFARKSGTSNRGSAVGIEVIDGELTSTPATEKGMNALYQLKDGTICFNLFQFEVTVTAPNGLSEQVRHINKYDDLTGIVMYTRAWNNLTLPSEFNMAHVVVENDVVTQIRDDLPPGEIPEDGYVLTCLKDYNMFLLDHFQVGDPVKLDITTTPNHEAIEQAVGGGAYLVVDGKVPSSFSHNITGYNPRTAIGVDASGKKVYMVAVDGRQAAAKGMTQTEMGYLMAEIGCHTALNLDGGGSTTMVIKPAGGEQQVVNSPSDGSLRNVANGVGITVDTSGAEMVGAKLNADDSRVINGTSRWVWLDGYDQFYQKMDIPQEEVEWTVDGVPGEVIDNMFYPKGVGTATLTARWGEFHDVMRLEVVGVPYSLSFDAQEVRVAAGESRLLYLHAKDENGFSTLVYPRDVNISIPDGLGVMDGNRITALQSGSGIVTAYLLDVSANMAFYADVAGKLDIPEGVSLTDPLNRHDDITGADNSFQFTVFGKNKEIGTLYDRLLTQIAQRQLKKYGEKHAFVGSNTTETMTWAFADDYFLAKNYNRFQYKGSTFITMNNTKGTIFGSNATQWIAFQNDMAAAEGNVFIFLDDDNISSMEFEKKRFKEMVSDAAKRGCNVFVFGGSWGNFASAENGVRYISTAGIFDTVSAHGPVTGYNVKYWVVTVNGSSVSYEMRGVMDDNPL